LGDVNDNVLQRARTALDRAAGYAEDTFERVFRSDAPPRATDEVLRREARTDGSDPFVNELLESLRDTTAMFTTPSPTGNVELNCFDTDTAWIVYRAMVFALECNRRLLLVARRRTREVEPHTVGNITSRLGNITSFELVFCGKGPLQRVVAVNVWEQRQNDEIFSRAPNAYARVLSKARFDELSDDGSRHVRLDRLYKCPIDSECRFDVDFVYTWVNHADETWRQLITQFRDPSTIDWDRYRARDELRYSLRSVHLYAPWARNIYVVTNCDPPSWLKEHPKIRWVRHEDIYPRAKDYLPTFSSHSIESCLMRVEGLSEQFVYMNDDVFLGMPTDKETFFTPNGMSISYLEPYGLVLGEMSADKPDYMNAAINGRGLIEDTFGVSPTQLHLHTPHALLKSVLFDLEHRFPHEFDDVRRARFRSKEDVSVVSFLYHHWAYQKRRATRAAAARAVLIRASNCERSFADLLAGRRRLFFCINDGGASAFDDTFERQTHEFLSKFFAEPAPWEHR
jgi:hypothetical protein